MKVNCEWTICKFNSGYEIPTLEGASGYCKFDGEIHLKEAADCEKCGYDVDNLICDNFKY